MSEKEKRRGYFFSALICIGLALFELVIWVSRVGVFGIENAIEFEIITLCLLAAVILMLGITDSQLRELRESILTSEEAKKRMET